jgi:hypothetical protein
MEKIKYKLIRTKRKTLSLMINSDAELIVRAPIRMPKKIIEDFLRQKQKWIFSKIRLLLKRKSEKIKREYKDGEMFFFLGERYYLKVSGQVKGLELKNEFLLPLKYKEKAEQVFIKWYKNELKAIIEERIKIYADIMNLKFNGIKITSANKRWGSCTNKNNLNFSYKLAMAPLSSIDYVIVHELAHIKEKNHGKGFWRLVELTLPDYKKRQKWLKKNSHLLDL